MSTLLGDPFAPTWAGRPPNMPREDFRLWQAWWPLHRGGVVRVYYDVGLGAGAEYVGPDDQALRYMWLVNTQKRADVVLEYGQRLELVEVHSGATPNTVGRLLGYETLWLEDPVIGKPVSLRLITDVEDFGVVALARRFGIAVDIV